MRALLISNSTNAGEGFLEHATGMIKEFLGEGSNLIFIPYAAVSFSFDDYEAKVKGKFAEIGYNIESIHRKENKKTAIVEADAIVVGGGNTWHLLETLQRLGLLDVIINTVARGTNYVGWSAGSNIACPTIRTTNDMPIIEPENMSACALIPFQINPHYLDANPDGHAGETREQRIEEFLAVNPGVYVVGLREGSALLVEENNISLIGKKNVRIFYSGSTPVEMEPGDDLNFLIS
ncbi:MAG: dipeptidase PepE [Bacteroidetes bacterium]|nr:dipeptidase PepE [Bacteroidota bacterium]MBU1718182.1 dipeptidase PepE [Bacteroidota bacterium]